MGCSCLNSTDIDISSIWVRYGAPGSCTDGCVLCGLYLNLIVYFSGVSERNKSWSRKCLQGNIYRPTFSSWPIMCAIYSLTPPKVTNFKFQAVGIRTPLPHLFLILLYTIYCEMLLVYDMYNRILNYFYQNRLNKMWNVLGDIHHKHTLLWDGVSHCTSCVVREHLLRKYLAILYQIWYLASVGYVRRQEIVTSMIPIPRVQDNSAPDSLKCIISLNLFLCSRAYIRQTEHIVVMTKEESTYIVNFMTPGTGVVVLGCGPY